VSRLLEWAGKLAFTAVCVALAALSGGGASFVQRPVGAAYLVIFTPWFVTTALGRTTGVRSRHDRGQLPVVAALGVLSYPGILVFEPWEYATFSGPIPRDGPLAWAGLAVFAVGVALNAWAMWALRGMFTARLGVQPGQRLVTHGPYRHVRHPAYLSHIVSLTGVALALSSVIGLALTAAIVPVLLWRIRGEEAMLLAEFGDAYREYTRRTKRLIPGVY